MPSVACSWPLNFLLGCQRSILGFKSNIMCSTIPTRLFVTGQPGAGKSTLIARVLDIVAQHHPDIKQQCCGFWTEEVRQSGNRIGFDVHTMNGMTGVLARVGTQGPCVGKYSVDIQSFEHLALAELQKAVQPGSGVKLCVIDEIGKMELLCKSFFPAVKAVLDTPGIVVLGTIPAPPTEGGRDITEVAQVRQRPDVRVITVTRSNRDDLVTEVAEAVIACLRNSNHIATPVRQQEVPPTGIVEAKPHTSTVSRLQGKQWQGARVGHAAAPAGSSDTSTGSSTRRRPWQLQ